MASWLDNAKRGEFGATELLGRILGSQKTYQGGSNLFGNQPQPSNPQILGVQSPPKPNYVQYSAPIGPQPAPAGSGRSGGGGGQAVSTGLTAPPHDYGLDAIRARLDEARNQAKTWLSRAAEERDYVMNTLKSQAEGLRGRANERKTTAFKTLDQEGTKLDNVYERSRGSQRRRTDNAELQNRMRARALNRLDSSFYDDIQAENTADLTRALGVLDTEEADKEAALGTRRTETDQYFNELLADLDSQQAQAEREALRGYQTAQDQAAALERAGLMDYGESVDSRLGAIQQAAQQAAMQRMSLAAQLAQAGGSINSFNTIDQNLANSLGNNQGIASVNSAAPQLMAGSTQPQAMGLAQLLAMSGRRPEDLLRA